MAETDMLAIQNRLNYTWITIPGLITSDNYQDIEQSVLAEPLERFRRVALDLTHVKNLYSCGIGLLIRVRKRVGEAGGIICLVNISRKISDMLVALHLDKVFTLYSTDVEFEISQDDAWEASIAKTKPDFIAVSQLENDICKVNLSGNMTVTNGLAQFNEAVGQADVNRFLFDLTGLDLVDSFGAYLFEKAITQIHEQHGACVAYGANSSVDELFDLLLIKENLPCYKNEREALDALRDSSALA